MASVCCRISRTRECALSIDTSTDTSHETEPTEADDQGLEDLLVDELLVEEISIDGMCGVY